MLGLYRVLAEAGVLGTCARFLRSRHERRALVRAQDYVGSDDQRELRVTPKQRLALRLRASGKTIRQIAAIMGISERSTQTLLARARESARRLREAAMEFLDGD